MQSGHGTNGSNNTNSGSLLNRQDMENPNLKLNPSVLSHGKFSAAQPQTYVFIKAKDDIKDTSNMNVISDSEPSSIMPIRLQDASDIGLMTPPEQEVINIRSLQASGVKSQDSSSRNKDINQSRLKLAPNSSRPSTGLVADQLPTSRQLTFRMSNLGS